MRHVVALRLRACIVCSTCRKCLLCFRSFRATRSRWQERVTVRFPCSPAVKQKAVSFFSIDTFTRVRAHQGFEVPVVALLWHAGIK